jgi:hypothetical protein
MCSLSLSLSMVDDILRVCCVWGEGVLFWRRKDVVFGVAGKYVAEVEVGYACAGG